MIRSVSKLALSQPKFRDMQPRHLFVRLVYLVRDQRRRDPDNLIATQKPLVDGIVDSQFAKPYILDDNPKYIEPLMPKIIFDRSLKMNRLELHIEVVDNDHSEANQNSS